MYSLNTFIYTVFVSESPLDSVNLYSKESEPTKLLLLVYIAVDEDNVTVSFCGCDTISYSKELKSKSKPSKCMFVDTPTFAEW